MATLTKKQILAADDMKTVTVKVPEWGGEVFVKTWTAQEKADFEMGISEGKKVNSRQMRELAVVASCVDEKGNLLFGKDDVKSLSKKSGAALSRVFNVSSKLNHILASDVEDLAKNSGKTAG